MHLKLVSFAALAAVASAQSITSLLSTTPELSKLASVVTQFPDLVKFLSTTKDLTILAPTNAAIEKYLGGNGSSIPPKLLEAVVTYHVLPAIVPASAFETAPAFIPTLLHYPTLTNVSGGQVVEGFVKGKNIEIVSGLQRVSTVVKGDIKYDKGLIHIIDRVLTIPGPISITATLLGLKGVVGALEKTGLVEAVDTTPDLTVFVPNDDAFQKVAAQASQLTAEQLATVLGYHVVKGKVAYSSTLKNGQTLTTTTGDTVTITISGGNVFVNDAKVVIPDVLVSNGVVHVIDSVLLKPPQKAGGSNSTSGAGTPTATGAPPGSTGTGVSSYPPTGSPITPYVNAASSTKTGVLGFTASLAASFWLAV
ncbi:hypothetical protein MMC29_000157 [Sticta canariensis]|nr:hypothetical protein [Sticta canariensis]